MNSSIEIQKFTVQILALSLKHNDDTTLSYMKLQKSYVMVNTDSFSDTRNFIKQEIFYIV